MTKTTDELIAEKVIGLRRCKVMWAYWSVNPCWQEWTGSILDRKFSDGSDLPMGFELPDGRLVDYIPKYSWDFRLAWDVVERMKKDGFSFKLFQPHDSDAATVSFICSMGPCEKHGNPNRNHHGAYDVEADTFPLAICLAAIQALKIKL